MINQLPYNIIYYLQKADLAITEEERIEYSAEATLKHVENRGFLLDKESTMMSEPRVKEEYIQKLTEENQVTNEKGG